MATRTRVFAIVLAQLLVIATALACPWCGYSPSGWGFCKYGANVAYYDCAQYVADPWTGRTDCYTCGYCNGYYPYLSQACSAGDECEECLAKPKYKTEARSGASPKIDDKDLSWVGAPIDKVAIF